MKTHFTRVGLVGFLVVSTGLAAHAQPIYSGVSGSPSRNAVSAPSFSNPGLTGLPRPMANPNVGPFGSRSPVGQANSGRPNPALNPNLLGRGAGTPMNQAAMQGGNLGTPGGSMNRMATQGNPGIAGGNPAFGGNRPLDPRGGGFNLAALGGGAAASDVPAPPSHNPAAIPMGQPGAGLAGMPQGSAVQGQGAADLVLADVRLADAGDPAKKRGLLFHITVRNVGAGPVGAFEVGVLANKADEPAEDSVQGLGKAGGLAAGQATVVDVTLPIEVLGLNKNEQGQAAPFASLLVVIDPNNAINEAGKENNGALIPREQIQLVELRIHRLESPQARVNTGWIVRGEGLGRPDIMPQLEFGGIKIIGQVVERQNNLLRIKAPPLMLEEPLRGQLRLLTGDGKASNPLAIELAPPQSPQSTAAGIAPPRG